MHGINYMESNSIEVRETVHDACMQYLTPCCFSMSHLSFSELAILCLSECCLWSAKCHFGHLSGERRSSVGTQLYTNEWFVPCCASLLSSSDFSDLLSLLSAFNPFLSVMSGSVSIHGCFL